MPKRDTRPTRSRTPSANNLRENRTILKVGQRADFFSGRNYPSTGAKLSAQPKNASAEFNSADASNQSLFNWHFPVQFWYGNRTVILQVARQQVDVLAGIIHDGPVGKGGVGVPTS